MERLLLKGKSKEDMRLIANLAMRLGMTIEYINDDDLHTTLSAGQQQDLTYGNTEDENENVIREFRERNE